jgi:signal peptidase II
MAVFLFSLDRYLKNLALSGYAREIVSDILSFNFAPNYGIAFSIPLGGVEVLSLIIGVIIGALIWGLIVSIKRGDIVESISLLSVILGAVSNYYDRFLYGYVVDYFDLSYFTVFNIADCLIFIGILVFACKKAKPRGFSL